jgi:phage tail-like protein
VSALPPYRQFLALGALPGWQASAAHLSEDAAGAWRLDALAGAALPVAAGPAGFPVALAMSPGAREDMSIAVLDGETQRIALIDPNGQRKARTLSGIGGWGGDARQFDQARDFVFAEDFLAVADTGHGSVKIFSNYPFALLAVHGGLGAPARLAAGQHGALWVLDAAGQRVFSLDRDGKAGPALPGITAPVALAAQDGAVAVLADGQLLVFADGAAADLGSVPDGACVTFGPDGALYAGTTTGLIYGFARAAGGAWRARGIGVLGQPAAINRLVWQSGAILLALVAPEGAAAARLWRIDTQAAFARRGVLASDELDSGIAGCVWHRIVLDADIPAGTFIEVGTETYDAPGGASPADLIPPPVVLQAGALDCLVQGGAGRYLKLTLTLRGNGAATPVLRGIRVYYPRASWLQYLPAVFQEDPESADFLARLLSILQTDFDGFDETIDNISRYFDPHSVPAAWFAWLAAWLALPINPAWTDAQRRAVLKAAYPNYTKRGTPAGLTQLIDDYAGVPARLVEHFRLRQLITLPDDPAQGVAVGNGRLWSRDFYRRLQLSVYAQVGTFKLVGEPEPGIEPVAWGANAFSVFFDAEPGEAAATRKKVVTVVEREKPAHTLANYVPVYARMRIGVQATLGVDTRIGEAGQAVLGCISTLGYDAVLARVPDDPAMQAARAPVTTRIGIDARLN